MTRFARPPKCPRLLLDGEHTPAGSEGWDVVEQVAGDLDERLAAMFDRLDEPVVLIGMDTPQLTASDLAPAFAAWAEPAVAGYPDAWLGPACDGGFWALGMREPRGELVRGIPMSRSDTGQLQLQRLTQAGLRVGMLTPLTDVDTIADAHYVAAHAPLSRFAATLASFTRELVTL